MKTNKKQFNFNTLLSVISLALSICTLAIAILMTNQLSKIIKTTKEDVLAVSAKVNKMYSDIYGTSIEYDVSMFEEIKAKDISSLSKNNKIVIMIGRETCGYCAMFAPVLAEIQKDYKVDIKYIDIAKIIDYTSGTGAVLDEESNKILTSLQTNDKGAEIMEDYGATPLLLIVKDNKIINGQVGYSEYSNVATILDEEGFSKR